MTKKQKIFVEEYLIDLNATQAAIRAGYSPATARIIAAENLAKPNISAAVEKALAERSKRTGINADRVVKELARIAFVKITDVVDPYDVTIKADASEDDLAAIQSVKVKTMDGDKGSSEEREVKLNDKIRALELLGKHLGMWDDRLNVEMDGDININVNYGDDNDAEQGEQE
jgi:phage terminase small subunit